MHRLAIKYILHLQYLLSFPPNQKIPNHIVKFDPSIPAWVRGKNIPGAVSLADFEAANSTHIETYFIPEDSYYVSAQPLFDRDSPVPSGSASGINYQNF